MQINIFQNSSNVPIRRMNCAKAVGQQRNRRHSAAHLCFGQQRETMHYLRTISILPKLHKFIFFLTAQEMQPISTHKHSLFLSDCHSVSIFLCSCHRMKNNSLSFIQVHVVNPSSLSNKTFIVSILCPVPFFLYLLKLNLCCQLCQR